MRLLLTTLVSVALATASLTGEAVAAAHAEKPPQHRVLGLVDPCDPKDFRPVQDDEAYWYFLREEDRCAYADTVVPTREDQRWDNPGDCEDTCH
ncbi:hypothetical protein GCM10018785_17630 [Streptomyces longispororuber]|uniref:Secreted protein n=1 Tax=Streptomyces longispororuber TaxID=68230 RepID=A0A918ZFE6_9ACTN|nr:hypothetical protein [Streptomyces longispororuber]GHE48520.1 hypothetical protein GCM10018785_17630 [Streptomyces longispororuber]